MTLQEEAEQYAQELIEANTISLNDKSWIESIYKYVVNNSKYVEKQKLEFAIEQLKRFRESTFGKGVNVIKELEQQLKELEK